MLQAGLGAQAGSYCSASRDDTRFCSRICQPLNWLLEHSLERKSCTHHVQHVPAAAATTGVPRALHCPRTLYMYACHDRPHFRPPPRRPPRTARAARRAAGRGGAGCGIIP